MRVLSRLVLTLTATVLLAGSARAQDEIRVTMISGLKSTAALLMWPNVQAELKLTDEQKGKLEKLQEKYQAELKEIQPLDRFKRGEKSSEIIKHYTTAAAKALGKSLTPEQAKRMKQIETQLRHLGDVEAIKTMKLNIKQVEKLRRIDEIAEREMNEIFISKDDDATVSLKMGTVQVDAKERAWNMLTDAQKKHWRQITGEEFDLHKD